MNPVDRVLSVIQDKAPDRPPVSFWHHFPPGQVYGPAAVAAHLEHLRKYDLDFLKVMNDNGYPHSHPISTVADLSAVVPLRGDEEEFTRQLDLLSELKRELQGRVLMITTQFNAFTTLRHLITPPTAHKPPNLDASADLPSRHIHELLGQNYSAVQRALQTIAANLAKFVARCLSVGADGIFLSVRDDWVYSAQEPQLYRKLVEPTDREILASVSSARFNMLHACGRPVDFAAFGRYPVHAINWADRAAGPSISQGLRQTKLAICAGVDNQETLPRGTPKDVEHEVADAIKQAAGRPLMIAPGCTYDPAKVPAANLEAICSAVRR